MEFGVAASSGAVPSWGDGGRFPRAGAASFIVVTRIVGDGWGQSAQPAQPSRGALLAGYQRAEWDQWRWQLECEGTRGEFLWLCSCDRDDELT